MTVSSKRGSPLMKERNHKGPSGGHGGADWTVLEKCPEEKETHIDSQDVLGSGEC